MDEDREPVMHRGQVVMVQNPELQGKTLDVSYLIMESAPGKVENRRNKRRDDSVQTMQGEVLGKS
ncbi:MAG: hypothetical protein MPK62_00265 [Alphaproteobacteria bacterium]|nr:hypothetical protein [Alphaproteobacteria bacterium]